MVKKKKSIKKSLSTWFVKPTKRQITTFDDLKSSVLLVSLAINLVVLIFWLVIKVTNKYDDQVARFLFGN